MFVALPVVQGAHFAVDSLETAIELPREVADATPVGLPWIALTAIQLIDDLDARGWFSTVLEEAIFGGVKLHRVGELHKLPLERVGFEAVGG